MKYLTLPAGPLLALLVSSSVLALPTAASAADPVADRFAALDADGNGKISWEEFHAVNPNISRQGFDTMDRDKDESLSLEEWRAFYTNHGMDVPMGGMMSNMPARDAVPPQDPAGPTAPGAPQTPLVMPPTAPQLQTGPGPAMPPSAPQTGPASSAVPTTPLVMPPATPATPQTGAAPASPSSPSMPLVTPPPAAQPTQAGGAQ